MAGKKRSPAAARAGTFVALLRGVNVGGKNKLPMKELAALFGQLGCVDVRTYIQSGNVVFAAAAELAASLPARAAAAIAARFGLQVPVLVRSAAELRRALAANPFRRAGADPEHLHLGFLADAPTRAQIAALDPARSPGDEFAVRGREVYLRLPNGMARTKLTSAWFDSRLATTITVRNWRTAEELLAMTAAPPPH